MTFVWITVISSPYTSIPDAGHTAPPPAESSAVPRMWTVYRRVDNALLGSIHWAPRYHGYVFMSQPSVVLGPGHLHELLTFIGWAQKCHESQFRAAYEAALGAATGPADPAAR